MGVGTKTGVPSWGMLIVIGALLVITLLLLLILATVALLVNAKATIRSSALNTKALLEI